MRRIAKLIWRWNKKLSLKELLTICINLKHENFLLEYNSKDEINKFLKNHGHDPLKPENEKTLTRMLEQIRAIQEGEANSKKNKLSTLLSSQRMRRL